MQTTFAIFFTMRDSIRMLAFAAVIALAGAGCVRGARVAPLVVGPIVGAPSPDAFERVLQTARSQGYIPEGADLSLGVFRVATQWSHRGVPHELHVQCFASGHVQVIPAGPRVARRGGLFVVPGPLREEMVHFTRALAAGAGVSQHSARALAP